jgi:hypothetical protein
MKRNQDFGERYHTATLVLMARGGGYLRLNRSEEPYDAFYAVIKPLLRPEDYEPQPSERRRGGTEPRWHHGLREALWHMKDEKEGRVEYLGDGLYRLTGSGWNHLSTLNIPLQLLDLEIVDLGNGQSEGRYIHPVDGTVVETFGCGKTSLSEL